MKPSTFSILYNVNKFCMVTNNSLIYGTIQNKTITRTYIALVKGELKTNSATIDAPIGRSEKDRKKMEVTSKNSKDAIQRGMQKLRGSDPSLPAYVLKK